MRDARFHHSQTRLLRRTEIELQRQCLREPSRLQPRDVDALLWSLRLGACGRIRGEDQDHDTFETVAAFRHWLLEQVVPLVLVDDHASVRWSTLQRILPDLMLRVAAVRRTLLERHGPDLTSKRLDNEIRRKRLVLALGGGGGAGYAHLGLFATIAELGIEPALIVGSSMGALLGLYRAMFREYDPITLTFALPGPSDMGRVFSPYRGWSVYGFPGAFELHLRGLANELAREHLGGPMPPFHELAIPLRVLATGLRTGLDLGLNRVEDEIGRARTSLTPLALRRRFSLFASVTRTMVENPRFLSRVVFGGKDDLGTFDTLDAVGFSCAVPGLLHYDLFDTENRSVDQVRQLFSDRGFFRLTDGGIVSNVPCRTAWDTVYAGEIGTRNVFVLGADAFAPARQLHNLPYYAAQRLASRFVRLDQPFADYFLTWDSPPSPLEVLQRHASRERTLSKGRSQLMSTRPLLREAVRPLLSWASLEEAWSPVLLHRSP